MEHGDHLAATLLSRATSNAIAPITRRQMKATLPIAGVVDPKYRPPDRRFDWINWSRAPTSFCASCLGCD